jgi:outer membrane protein
LDLSLLSSRSAARLRTSEAEANRVTISEQARLTVIQLYLQALQADARIRAAEARRATADESLSQSKRAFDAGTSNKLEVTRAQQQVERESTTAINAARDRDTYITLLIKTLGFDSVQPVKLLPIAEPAEGPADGALLLKDALQQRPEAKALRINYQALLAEKQRAQRERLPKIQAEGDYGVVGQDPANSLSTWAVGGSLVIPIWTSKRIESEIQAAEIRLQEWAQQNRKLEQQIAQELAQAVIQREGARRSVQAAGRSASAARETLDLSRQRYGAGLATNLDVVSAQNNLAEAEEEEIRSRYDFWLALASLAYARGDARAFLSHN